MPARSPSAFHVLCRLIQPAPGDAPAKAARVCAANSAALREHFYALTRALLEPLQPFCMPVEAEPGSAASPLASFSHSAFLESLSSKSLPPTLLERFPSQVAHVPESHASHTFAARYP